jgi:hypothetical protein
VAELAASIVEWGWTNPVLADATGIVAGHGRILAARALYAQGKRIALPSGQMLPDGTVPVVDCTGWNDAKRRAYVIADTPDRIRLFALLGLRARLHLTVTTGMSAASLLPRILEGRGDGTWTGTSGITSSAAAAAIVAGESRAVGWLDAGGGAFTVGFAAPGDTNLDDLVDVLDAANFVAPGLFDTVQPATWNQGDFNYDGMVDILDAAEFMSTGLFDAGFYDRAAAVAAVPEPMAGPLLIGAAGVALSGLAARPRRPCRQPSP